MGMMGFCTAPSRAKAADKISAARPLGSCQDTRVSAATPRPANPAAARSAASRNPAKVITVPSGSMVRGTSGVAAARASMASQ